MDTPLAPIVHPTPRDSAAHRFFRRAFSIFISFAVLLTLVLVAETLWLGRENLKGELSIYQRSFEKSLAAAIWAMDREKLDSIVRGIVEIPDIKGVRILDPDSGEVIVQSGSIPDAETDSYPLAHRFAVVHDEGFGKETVARAEFHSSFSQLLRRTQTQIALIIAVAALKTLAFWVIFLYVGKRLLGQPLTEMADAIAAADGSRGLQLSGPTEKAIADTELAVLRDAYDTMAGRMRAARAALERANEELESRVLKRTEELEQANRRLDELAHTDPLTGLPNRRQFIAEAETAIARARRSGRPLSIVVCDIDLFKQVNDVHGHVVGDRAISHVAAHLQASIREVDMVARFGGDEFVILLPDISLAEARVVAERLRQNLCEQDLVLDQGGSLAITLSIGIAALVPEDLRFEDLFHRADNGLYMSKSAGRNRVSDQPFQSSARA